MTKNTAKWREVTDQGDLCLTGDGLVHLQIIFNKDDLNRLLAKVRVFARFDPKQKEFVITSLRDAGFYVLMCGDGTNDVGALKHAHVGVAILSSQPGAEKNKESTKKSSDLVTKTPNSASKKIGKRPGLTNDGEPQMSRQARHQQKLQELLKEIEESEKAAIVKLGDASIAAPFTSKHSSIVCINHIIKQGRCTLVTTLQVCDCLLEAIQWGHTGSTIRF